MFKLGKINLAFKSTKTVLQEKFQGEVFLYIKALKHIRSESFAGVNQWNWIHCQLHYLHQLNFYPIDFTNVTSLCISTVIATRAQFWKAFFAWHCQWTQNHLCMSKDACMRGLITILTNLFIFNYWIISVRTNNIGNKQLPFVFTADFSPDSNQNIFGWKWKKII